MDYSVETLYKIAQLEAKHVPSDQPIAVIPQPSDVPWQDPAETCENPYEWMNYYSNDIKVSLPKRFVEMGERVQEQKFIEFGRALHYVHVHLLMNTSSREGQLQVVLHTWEPDKCLDLQPCLDSDEIVEVCAAILEQRHACQSTCEGIQFVPHMMIQELPPCLFSEIWTNWRAGRWEPIVMWNDVYHAMAPYSARRRTRQLLNQIMEEPKIHFVTIPGPKGTQVISRNNVFDYLGSPAFRTRSFQRPFYRSPEWEFGPQPYANFPHAPACEHYGERTRCRHYPLCTRPTRDGADGSPCCEDCDFHYYDPDRGHTRA